MNEKRNEFIFNESVFDNENPSREEFAEAQAKAEKQRDKTDD